MKRLWQKLKQPRAYKTDRTIEVSKNPLANEHADTEGHESSPPLVVEARAGGVHDYTVTINSSKPTASHPASGDKAAAVTANPDIVSAQLSPGQTRGLKILKSSAQASLDIIFIHGLTGDSLRTWQHESGVYWPTDLLPQELPETRVLTFGYDADVTNVEVKKLFFGPVGQSTLRNHATTLVCEYAAIRLQDSFSGKQRKDPASKILHADHLGVNQHGNDRTKARKVILIAHSLVSTLQGSPCFNVQWVYTRLLPSIF